MSEIEEVQSPNSVGTQEWAARICEACGDAIPASKRLGTRFCSRSCQHSTSDHVVRDMERKMMAALRVKLRNIAFAHLHRDRSIGFDGRYEGPLNQPLTLLITLRKDHGYHPIPIDVHVRPVEPKHSVMTVEDHDWATRQRAFEHTLGMPRSYNNFCVSCAEMVIDPAANTVRVTRGVYLPIEHQCNSVRVYNLAGKLLEVKQL